MHEQPLQVLIYGGGGVAGQRLYGNKFTDPDVMGLTQARDTSIHLYDTRGEDLPIIDDLRHLKAARSAGQLTISAVIPDQAYDIAVVTTPSGMHAESLDHILEHQQRFRSESPLIIVEKPIASGVEEERHIAEILSRPEVDADRIFVHEPYLLVDGIDHIKRFIASNAYMQNPLASIDVWSSKNKIPDILAGRSEPVTNLAAYGVEFPHTYGAACRLSGLTLGQEHIHRNDYYKQIDGLAHNDGTFTEFRYTDRATGDDVRVRIAQGLGAYEMSRDGVMTRNPNPPMVRQAQVTLDDGKQVHINLNPSVDGKAARPYGRHTALTYYDSDGTEVRSYRVEPDYPIKKLLKHVVTVHEYPVVPRIGIINPRISLERCKSIRKIQEHATVIVAKMLE